MASGLSNDVSQNLTEEIPKIISNFQKQVNLECSNNNGQATELNRDHVLQEPDNEKLVTNIDNGNFNANHLQEDINRNPVNAHSGPFDEHFLLVYDEDVDEHSGPFDEHFGLEYDDDEDNCSVVSFYESEDSDWFGDRD